MNRGRPRLAFVSPLFLLPADAGGKIRTGNILRGMKGGRFDLTLISPATPQQQADWGEQLSALCDRFVPWLPAARAPRWRRATDLLGTLPVNVAADRNAPALLGVSEALSDGAFDAVVFDFVHSAVLMPPELDCATVCFTHNVEAEIFERHAVQAAHAPLRALWRSQQRKMARYEGDALRGFDAVIAVSQRDADQFRQRYGIEQARAIPTGVDLEFFAWREPATPSAVAAPTVVFTGSMDWDANIDGVRFFLAAVWPLVRAQLPQARFVVVGRSPPAALTQSVGPESGVSFTGFVDDVRPYVRAAHAFVIPLRVGGGTRIKAFEAMAMGCPVVSTTIGIEGLSVTPGQHFLQCDDPNDQAQAVLALLRDADLRNRLSVDARRCVEERFGHRVAALAFEAICLDALDARRTTA